MDGVWFLSDDASANGGQAKLSKRKLKHCLSKNTQKRVTAVDNNKLVIRLVTTRFIIFFFCQ